MHVTCPAEGPGLNGGEGHGLTISFNNTIDDLLAFARFHYNNSDGIQRSVAIQRFIASRQPLITLHGHIHESTRLTGAWRDRMGNTHAFSAAHDGPELALVRFDPSRPEQASRELV